MQKQELKITIKPPYLTGSMQDPYIKERHRRKAAEANTRALWWYVAVLWVIIIIQVIIIMAR